MTAKVRRLIESLPTHKLKPILIVIKLMTENEKLKTENAKLKKEAEGGAVLLTEALYLVEKYAPKPPLGKD